MHIVNQILLNNMIYADNVQRFRIAQIKYLPGMRLVVPLEIVTENRTYYFVNSLFLTAYRLQEVLSNWGDYSARLQGKDSNIEIYTKKHNRKGKHTERLKTLSDLNSIRAHKNIAFIGPPGTGKTHLAQAYGYECCQNGFKTYFIKMSELRDKFTVARRNGKEASCLNGLVRPACLIIDEVGHCEFDKENTRLFFDMVDRRYNRQGINNIVFTSNKNPAQWKNNFSDDDDLLCALDRIFDDATVFNIRGDSYRGKKLENITLQTSRVNSEMTST